MDLPPVCDGLPAVGCLTQRYVKRQDSTRKGPEVRCLLNFRFPYFEILLEGQFLGGRVQLAREARCLLPNGLILGRRKAVGGHLMALQGHQMEATVSEGFAALMTNGVDPLLSFYVPLRKTTQSWNANWLARNIRY